MSAPESLRSSNGSTFPFLLAGIGIFMIYAATELSIYTCLEPYLSASLFISGLLLLLVSLIVGYLDWGRRKEHEEKRITKKELENKKRRKEMEADEKEKADIVSVQKTFKKQEKNYSGEKSKK